VQSIEYISVDEVIQPKTLLSLEVRVNSVDDVAIFLAPVETGVSLNSSGDYSVATAAKSENKSGFVKEFLNDHPDGNVDAVNKAWAAAGMNGAIGSTLVNKMRAALGLTGNLRGNTKMSNASATSKKRAEPRKETTAAANEKPRDNRSAVLNDMEVDLDRLMFKAMAIGDLTEIEDTLRLLRRLLYGALTRG
jgi:hypothetical protein